MGVFRVAYFFNLRSGLKEGSHLKTASNTFLNSFVACFHKFGKQKKISSKAVLTREQRSLPNDATQLASKNLILARIFTIPFNAKTQCASVFDSKLPTDFLGFLAHLRVKSYEALDVDKKPKRGE